MNEHADFMTESNVLAMFRQIVEAVEYMHKEHVMHCDIKPENILVSYSPDHPGLPRLYLTDLGLSVDFSKQITSQNAVGTLAYMAPELFEDRCQFDTKPESWALGVTLYHMLTFEEPIEGDDEIEYIEEILSKSIQFDKPSLEIFQIDTIDLLENLLARDPAQRLPVLEILRHCCF